MASSSPARPSAREIASFMNETWRRTAWPSEAADCSASRSGSARRIATSVMVEERRRSSSVRQASSASSHSTRDRHDDGGDGEERRRPGQRGRASRAPAASEPSDTMAKAMPMAAQMMLAMAANLKGALDGFCCSAKMRPPMLGPSSLAAMRLREGPAGAAARHAAARAPRRRPARLRSLRGASSGFGAAGGASAERRCRGRRRCGGIEMPTALGHGAGVAAVGTGAGWAVERGLVAAGVGRIGGARRSLPSVGNGQASARAVLGVVARRACCSCLEPFAPSMEACRASPAPPFRARDLAGRPQANRSGTLARLRGQVRTHTAEIANPPVGQRFGRSLGQKKGSPARRRQASNAREFGRRLMLNLRERNLRAFISCV